MDTINSWGPYKAVIENDGTLATQTRSGEDPLLVASPGQFFEHNHEGKKITDVVVVEKEVFDHLMVRPDADALHAVHELKGKNAVVLYFETDQDREDFVKIVKIAKPGMRAVNL